MEQLEKTRTNYRGANGLYKFFSFSYNKEGKAPSVPGAKGRRKRGKENAMINVLHLKYALEVAKAGSINKAAEALYMNQPNLSRAIKELEASLGITIFGRSAKGMYVTPEGEEFLGHARKILRQIDEVEAIYKGGVPARQYFSLVAQRTAYAAQAFANFTRGLSRERAEIFYTETGASQVLQGVHSGEYKLGLLRYAVEYEKHFKEALEEKGLTGELVAELPAVLVMNRLHPLAAKAEISPEDLRDSIEIVGLDPFVPALPAETVKKELLPEDTPRRAIVIERAAQLELLSCNPEAYLRSVPLPEALRTRYGLVEKSCPARQPIFKDMLIYRKGYRLSQLDCDFITALTRAKRALGG